MDDQIVLILLLLIVFYYIYTQGSSRGHRCGRSCRSGCRYRSGFEGEQVVEENVEGGEESERSMPESTVYESMLAEDIEDMEKFEVSFDGMADSIGDYASTLASQTLDKSTFASHEAFANEYDQMGGSGSASRATKRDDCSDLNPRVGLRKIDYNVKIDRRQHIGVPSEDYTQLCSPDPYRWNCYV